MYEHLFRLSDFNNNCNVHNVIRFFCNKISTMCYCPKSRNNVRRICKSARSYVCGWNITFGTKIAKSDEWQCAKYIPNCYTLNQSFHSIWKLAFLCLNNIYILDAHWFGISRKNTNFQKWCTCSLNWQCFNTWLKVNVR